MINRAAAFLAALLLGVLALAGTAGAQSTFVTDYATYPDTPQAQLPDGCDGGGLWQGQMFSLNGGPSVSSMRGLPELAMGDVITMSWARTTPECVGAPVVLDVKVAASPFFDPGADQQSLPYVSVIATGGPQSLSLTMPDLRPFSLGCNYQVDAIVGLPLEIVGPSGSDYSAPVRGDELRTTLIDWRNGAYPTCMPDMPPTDDTPIDTQPAPAPPADAPPTLPPAETPPPAPAPAADRTPAAVPIEASSSTVVAAAPPPAGALPVTGSSSVPMAVAGGLLLVLGAMLVLVPRWKAAR